MLSATLVQRGGAWAEDAPIICDVPVEACIDSPAESDRFSFNVIDNEIVAINVLAAPAQGAGFDPVWRVIDKLGNPIQDNECDDFGDAYLGSLRDCGPLPASGSPYRVEVRDGSSDATGCYHVHLQRLTEGAVCEPTPVGCDGTAPGTIDPALEDDLIRFDFSVTEGEIVAINLGVTVPGTNFDPTWRLLDRTGRPV
ncbi:MAG: hypothetical protein HY271_05160, partial [Deltaproteobacteria bacterium]|nr:hypothetical protein [Deltaproteobacteria bacterium]